MLVFTTHAKTDWVEIDPVDESVANWVTQVDLTGTMVDLVSTSGIPNDCEIRDNSADDDAGGAYFNSGSLRRCSIIVNSSHSGAGVKLASRGAIFSWPGNLFFMDMAG